LIRDAAVHVAKLTRIIFCSLTLAPFLMVHAEGPAIVGKVLAADGKGIAQAIVFVQDAADASRVAMQPATMDQFNKTFVPGVLPIVVGTRVRFPNRDQIRHHVYSFSRAKNFELPLYKGEDAPPVLFDKVGVVKIGCNIHDWMSAIILVLPNRHYVATDDSGRFRLDGLPAGDYSLTAWHAQSREKPEDIAQRVQLASDDVEISLTLTLAPVRARPATRGARWDQ
jgi:plastocyanin